MQELNYEETTKSLDEIMRRIQRSYVKDTTKDRAPVYYQTPDFSSENPDKDFEEGTRIIGSIDYCQIPFQYSLHIEQADGSLEHREFLAKEGTDPRRAIAESLCKDFPTDVCVLAYNMSFERGVIERLAEIFPDLADHLLAIRDNIHDLMIPFLKQHYYSKAMQGSYSIKYVLPALCPGDPELDYHALEGVHNGSEAMDTFADLLNHTPEEIKVM